MRRLPHHGKSIGRKLLYLLTAVVLTVGSASAQIELLDENLKLNLNGLVGFGYAGSFGSSVSSSHNNAFNGLANISGSYYHPNFINFNLQPYYNWSQNSSAATSSLDTTGFTGGVNFFSGSRLPGSVSYSRASSGSDQFGLPGISGVATEGSSDALTITWSALFPNYPTLTASYSNGHNSSNILGTNSTTEGKNTTFSLGSSYSLAGWRMMGSYNRQSLELDIPAFLGGGENFLSSTGSSSFGVSADHQLPMTGSFSVGWNRTSAHSDGSGSSETVSNNLNANATINPTKRFTLNGDIRYFGNLLGQLRQDLGGNGFELLDNNSHSLSFGGFGSYALGYGFGLRGHVNHRRQYFLGRDVNETLYGGTVTYRYSRPLFGLLYFNFGMVDTVNERGNSGLAFNGSVGLTRKFGKWETQADLAYSQNVQTLLALYSTSSINYGFNVRRQINWRTYWSGTYRRVQSALVQNDGDDNVSQSVSSNFTWWRYTFTGAYANSSGASVLTASGVLLPTPIPGAEFDNLLLFNGRSYTIGLGLLPIKRMSLNCSYTNAYSDTIANSIFSVNKTERVYSRLEYKLRQLSIIGGFTRYRQGISASGAPPSVVNSYSIGIARWFDVF
jgi:hypothetical protein